MHIRWLKANISLLIFFLSNVLNTPSLASPVAQQQVKAKSLVSLKLGEASGRVTVKSKTIEVTYAYARKVSETTNSDDKAYVVFLSDEPVSEEIWKKKKDFDGGLLFDNKEGMYLHINNQGRIINVIMWIRLRSPSGEMGEFANSYTGPYLGEQVKIDGKSIEGESRYTGEIKGQKNGYTVAFKAMMIK